MDYFFLALINSLKEFIKARKFLKYLQNNNVFKKLYNERNNEINIEQLNENQLNEEQIIIKSGENMIKKQNIDIL